MTDISGGPRVFVTVGSTKFVNLIKAVLSAPFLDAVSQAASELGKGEASITIQFGSTAIQDIVFKNGSYGMEDVDEGTLPIRLLGGKRKTVETEPSEIAESLSPEAIQKAIAEGNSTDDDQLGLKHFAMDRKASHGTVHLELIDYVSSIGPYLQSADVIISHAGSGTILEALRVEGETRPQLIVVPNETLMSNHQTELAKKLMERHYAYATRLSSNKQDDKEIAGKLPALLRNVLSKAGQDNMVTGLQNFPPFVPGRFRSLMDSELGF